MNAIAFSVLTCIARGFIRSSILSEQIKKITYFINMLFSNYYAVNVDVTPLPSAALNDTVPVKFPVSPCAEEVSLIQITT